MQLGRASITSYANSIILQQLMKGIRRFTVGSSDTAGNTGEDRFPWM